LEKQIGKKIQKQPNLTKIARFENIKKGLSGCEH
jgi:hypothetical protein